MSKCDYSVFILTSKIHLNKYYYKSSQILTLVPYSIQSHPLTTHNNNNKQALSHSAETAMDQFSA